MTTTHGLTVDVYAILLLRCALGFGAAAMSPVPAFQESIVRLLTVLPFGVLLCALLLAASLCHVPISSRLQEPLRCGPDS